MRADFKQFFQAMDAKGRAAFAKRSGYSGEYLRIHLIRGTKTPTIGGLVKLAKASNGVFQPGELLDWFLMANKEAEKNGAYRGPQNNRSARKRRAAG